MNTKRSKKYTIPKLILVTILGLIGIILIKKSNILSVNNYDALFACIKKYTIEILLGLMCIIFFFYYALTYLIWLIYKPKKEIVYLSKIEDNICTFISKNGKEYKYKNCNKTENKHYYVIKNQFFIYEVLEECTDTNLTIQNLKERYWSTYYFPYNKYENTIILPFIYILMIPGILTILFDKSNNKIFGFIWCLIPFVLIMYDLFLKIKNKKNLGNEEHISTKENLRNLIIIIGTLIPSLFLTYTIYQVHDLLSKFIFFGLLCESISFLGYAISKVINNKKIEKIFKILIIIFALIYFIGLLTFCFYLFLKK